MSALFIAVVFNRMGSDNSMRVFRRFWVTGWNALFVGFVIYGLVDDYSLYQLSGPIKPPNFLLHAFVSIALVCLLVFGIVAECLDWTWPAILINAGFFAFLGFGVLGKVLVMTVTETPAQYHSEVGLTIAIVGVPCSIIAIADFFLYWKTRHLRSSGLPPV